MRVDMRGQGMRRIRYRNSELFEFYGFIKEHYILESSGTDMQISGWLAPAIKNREEEAMERKLKTL